MASDESLPTLKILLIGPSGAGKSARKTSSFAPVRRALTEARPVLIRYCDDYFDAESSTATIGVDFKARSRRSLRVSTRKRLLTTMRLEQIKKLSVRGNAYRLNLLDTAGQGTLARDSRVGRLLTKPGDRTLPHPFQQLLPRRARRNPRVRRLEPRQLLVHGPVV